MTDNAWMLWLLIPLAFVGLLVAGETVRWIDNGECPFGVVVSCEVTPDRVADSYPDPVGAALQNQLWESQEAADKDRQYQEEEMERLRREAEFWQDEALRTQGY